MRPLPSTPSADTLSLLLRQRDLQPFLGDADQQSLALTSKTVRASMVRPDNRPLPKRYAELLARQCTPDPRLRHLVVHNMLRNLTTMAHPAPVDVAVLHDCRELIWQADVTVRGPSHHTNAPVLPAQRRRTALAFLYAARAGCDMARALERIDEERRRDSMATVRLYANDALAVTNAGLSVTFGLSTAKATQHTAHAASAWWQFGGTLGVAGASVMGVATGGLAALTGGAAVFAVDVLTHRAKTRGADLAATPYSVERDLQLCVHAASRQRPRAR